VAIFEGATSKASGLTLLADGTYTTTITSTVGAHSFVAKFVGDTTYAPIASTPVSVTVGKVALVTPANAAVVTTATPDLTWTQYPGATGYVVQVSTASAFTAGAATREVIIGDGATVTTASPALVKGTVYYWRVIATWPTGNKSVYSDARTVTYKTEASFTIPAVNQTGLSVTMTTTLTYGDGLPMVGKSVSFFEGATSKATGTTTSDGSVTATFTNTAGTHQVSAKFAGDATYAPASSATVQYTSP